MNDLRDVEPAGGIDFAIVGAGPVGLLAAILLGRGGWNVTVIEKWPARYPMPRACTIDHEALRILQCVGIMDQHAELFEPSHGDRGGYQIRNGKGELLRSINWNRPAESGWANTNGFYQPDLENVLETMASELPSVTIRRGWSATDIRQSDDEVILTVSEEGEKVVQETVRASWLIGADGANSAIRDLLGIDSVDSGFEADWLVVDYEPLDTRRWDAFVTQYCDPRQPATAVASGPGRRRFEFMRRADVSTDELKREETAWALMAPWGITPQSARLERHAVYTFRGCWVQEWRRGRVFLAGDAAHLMPPFLGQGLCSGLRDAASLAWRLSMVSSGTAGESILDSYGSERGAHVREIIDEAISLGQLICELDQAKADDRDSRMIAELADSGALAVEPPHPRLGHPSVTEPHQDDDNAGRLSVQGRVSSFQKAGLFDDIVGGDWQLIGLGAGSVAGIPEELRRWFIGIGGTVTALTDDGAVRDVDGTYRAWFEAHNCTIVLSRPDFYVFGTGGPGGGPRLLQKLRDALGTGVPLPSRDTRTARTEEGALR